MKKAFGMAAAAVVALLPAGGNAATTRDVPPEGCIAIAPAQPSCSYVATATITFGGAAGQGKWVVTVKHGKKTTTYKSPASGEPAGNQFPIVAGDKVTAKALSPGSGVIVGGG